MDRTRWAHAGYVDKGHVVPLPLQGFPVENDISFDAPNAPLWHEWKVAADVHASQREKADGC